MCEIETEDGHGTYVHFIVRNQALYPENEETDKQRPSGMSSLCLLESSASAMIVHRWLEC